MPRANFTARDVLEQLDDDARRAAAFFPDFDHGYLHHVGGRLTAYGDADRWVIVIEQLVVNPRAWPAEVGGTMLNLHDHGNAVTLGPEPGRGDRSVRSHHPLAVGSRPLLIGDGCSDVDLAADDVRIRGELVPIRTDANYYWARHVDVDTPTHEQIDTLIRRLPGHLPPHVRAQAVRTYESMRADVGRFKLSTWDLVRGLVPGHRDALLSTDTERRAGVADGLRQLLQVEEWDHPRLLDGELPSGCESFKLVARVLATGDPGAYQVTEPPNTHWSRWSQAAACDAETAASVAEPSANFGTMQDMVAPNVHAPTDPHPTPPAWVAARRGGPVPLSSQDVEAMVQAGVVPEDATTELLHGTLIKVDRAKDREVPLGIGDDHVFAVEALSNLRAVINGQSRHVQSQQPLIRSQTHAPQPDFMVVRGRFGSRRRATANAADAFCVVEVADSSYERDADEKLFGYARAGVPQYVIVNLRNRTAEVYASPDVAAGTYPPSGVVAADDVLLLRVGDDVEPFAVRLADVLP